MRVYQRIPAQEVTRVEDAPAASPPAEVAPATVAEEPAISDLRAASVPRQVKLDLRLRPGLYRLTVRVQLEDGTLTPPARRFLRVVG